MPSRRDPPCSTGCRARTAGRRNSSVHVISIQTIQYLHEPRVYQHCLWRKTHWHWPLSRFLQRCRQTSQSPLCWPGTGQPAVVVHKNPFRCHRAQHPEATLLQTDHVPAWCWHSATEVLLELVCYGVCCVGPDSCVEETKMVTPSDPNGQQFTLPGQAGRVIF